MSESVVQFLIKDGGEWVTSDPHEHDDDCPRCCCYPPERCEDCGGRYHHEPVEGMTANGWEVVHAHFCENGPHADDVEFDDYRPLPKEPSS